MTALARIAAYLRRNHVAVIALFLALGGGAYAAAGIDSGDVKNKSLKNKNFRQATITGKQIADDALGGAVIDESTLELSRVSARLRDPTDRTVPRGVPIAQFGSVGPWTQRAGETNEIFGQVMVRFPAGCTPGRLLSVYLARPGSSFPLTPFGGVAAGQAVATTPGAQTIVVPISSAAPLIGFASGLEFEPSADAARSLNVFAQATCGGGSTADPVITDMNLDVIGHR